MIAFHPSALAEIERARDWYDQKRDGLGVDLVDEVERVLALIETAPRSFPRARESRLASTTISSSATSAPVETSPGQLAGRLLRR